VYVNGLRNALQRDGVEVHTVAGHGAHAIDYPAVFHRAPLDFSLQLNRDSAPLLAPHGDVIHAQGGPGGVLLLRRLSTPLLYTAHHTYRQAYGVTSARRALAPLERRSYRLAATVIAVSPSTASAVAAMGVRNVEVVPPGIDVDTLGALGESRRDPDLLLFVGRLEPEKGPLQAVAVMRAVAARRPGVRGVIVGRGSLEPEVHAAAKKSGGVVEVRGPVPADELRELYARAAVLLVPSRYEGLGFVALEAMAAGAAVVAHDVTGLRDAVGGHGVLVPQGDTEAMVAAATALLADPERRRELAEAAGLAVRSTHSWTACARGVQELYRHVAATG
jgi:glycosyltransferase involved in cell wall biosynthesis